MILGQQLLPSAESLAYRAHLASLISPLRRVRPRVPFYQLAAHRIPTLWRLYRGLLRAAPGENIRFRVQMLFRRNQYSTSPKSTRKELLKGHRWLEIFTKANQGDAKLHAILSRYENMISIKREKEKWKRILRDEFAWQEKLRKRPILTGSYLRPSLYNRPLPRMKHQPVGLSMMIHKRRIARERRLEKNMLLHDWRDDLRREQAFEETLARNSEGKFDRAYEDSAAWERPLLEVQKTLRATFNLDTERQLTPYPPDLLEAIKQARREKVANKTRELERERHGQILPRTIERRNKGPPAHILRKMTKKEKRMDRVVRSVSEVGYVAQIKRQLGFKFKDAEAWKKEIGGVEDKPRLDRMLENIRRENDRRRKLREFADKDM